MDHKDRYQPPKKKKKADGSGGESEEEEEGPKEYRPGHVYEGKELATGYSLFEGVDPFAAPGAPRKDGAEAEAEAKQQRRKKDHERERKRKKAKKAKKETKKKHKAKKHSRDRAVGDAAVGSEDEIASGTGQPKRRRLEEGAPSAADSLSWRDAPPQPVAPAPPLGSGEPQAWRGRMDPMLASRGGSEPQAWRGRMDPLFGRGGGQAPGGGRGAGGAGFAGRKRDPDIASSVAGIHRRR